METTWRDRLGKFVRRNAPEILTGLAVVGTVISAVAWYKSSPKIHSLIRNCKKDLKEIEERNDLDDTVKRKDRKEVIVATAPDMLVAVAPPILATGGAIACAVASNRASAKKLGAAMAAYGIATQSLESLKASIKEVVPKKAQEVHEHAVAQDVQKDPLPSERGIYSTRSGDVLCKDIYLRTYFRSDHESIAKAINATYKEILSRGWASVADFYGECGMRNEDIPPIAREIGWGEEDCQYLNSAPISIVTTWDQSGTIPVIGIDYEVVPFPERNSLV